jgi:hypothetical protein
MFSPEREADISLETEAIGKWEKEAEIYIVFWQGGEREKG